MVLAGFLCAVSSPAQSLNNQSLSGKYYFRHVSLGTDGRNPGNLIGARTLMGSITKGLAPGFPGLYQLNVNLPQFLKASGNLPLAIQTMNAYHDQVDIPIL